VLEGLQSLDADLATCPTALSPSPQFGVGFYSAFLVADRVRVVTKSVDEGIAWGWEASAGSHEFKINQEQDASLKRGTR